MTVPQSGILPESSPFALFLTLSLQPRGDRLDRTREGLRAFPRLTRELSDRYRDAGLASVAGIGSDAWERLYPGNRTRDLHPFVPLRDGERSAPSTPADLFLHIRSNRPDVNFLLARAALDALESSVERIEEVSGFRFLEGRDLTGFVDGTENPRGEKRGSVALVGEEDPAFAGGSHVHIQRYVHDLAGWENLPVSAQEQAIGRSKQDDVELDGRSKPPTAHIGRVVIQENGEELEILRHSMPYGDTSEAGLYFVAYGRTPHPFEAMLRRMILADEAGHFDHLMRYTRAVTGAAFFAPSLGFLAGGTE